MFALDVTLSFVVGLFKVVQRVRYT